MTLSNPIFGVLLHAIGATAAAFCYTPQKGTRGWSWQTFWLAQASICWFVLPLLVAWLTIPELGKVLSEAPVSAMRNAFLLGAFYGIGAPPSALLLSISASRLHMRLPSVFPVSSAHYCRRSSPDRWPS